MLLGREPGYLPDRMRGLGQVTCLVVSPLSLLQRGLKDDTILSGFHEEQMAFSEERVPIIA